MVEAENNIIYIQRFMEFKDFMKDELTKFARVLKENGISGDAWSDYMNIKVRLLKNQFLLTYVSAAGKKLNTLQPVVRIRDGKVVWYGVETGDFLSKTDILDMEYLNNPEKHGFHPRKLYNLAKVGEIQVLFPSDDATVFVPSAVSVLQQLPENISPKALLFEIRWKDADVCKTYDAILQTHEATVVLYRMVYPVPQELERQQERLLPEAEKPNYANAIKVKEVEKVKEPHRPRRLTPVPRSQK